MANFITKSYLTVIGSLDQNINFIIHNSILLTNLYGFVMTAGWKSKHTEGQKATSGPFTPKTIIILASTPKCDNNLLIIGMCCSYVVCHFKSSSSLKQHGFCGFYHSSAGKIVLKMKNSCGVDSQAFTVGKHTLWNILGDLLLQHMYLKYCRLFQLERKRYLLSLYCTTSLYHTSLKYNGVID